LGTTSLASNLPLGGSSAQDRLRRSTEVDQGAMDQ
jgi:hypothetical protein